jgi:translation initiation factor IF-2
MRVHELAKEFGMTSKELLDRLAELKIPAKNHASTLVEAYVDKIRKALGPEIAERQAALEEERKVREAEEAKVRAEEEARHKAEEEARRKREEEDRKVHEAEEAAKRAEEEARHQAEEEARLAREAEEAAEQAKREAEEAARLEKQEEERYRQMALAAEKLEKDKVSKVIEEAKAAVAAAAAQGPKKKKHKKPSGDDVIEAQHHAATLPEEAVCEAEAVKVTEGATVGDFAEALGVTPNEIIKRLMLLGQMLTVNQAMTRDVMEIVADDLCRPIQVVSPEEEEGFVFVDKPEDLKPRPPVVTVMGHVDHGKTSLLDAIRETGVAATEAGGITQHIGASVVQKNGRQITFIDTPGHEAFTAMRARGAKVTDVVVLVVAADDGVMPQTVEAIDHAKAAGVPIIVAVNKIDKENANPDRVRQELTEYEVVPEEWGGSNIFVNVSAKKRLHIDDILEMILLQADVLELKANPDAPASGFVIEAKLDKGRGPVATVLVQRGTLKAGDAVVAGTSHGRVRALVDPKGKQVKGAGPAEPVEILGLASVPSAGDEFRVCEDEREARQIAEERALRLRLLGQQKSHVSLDDLFARIQEGELKDLNLVVKADVQGSIEALKDALDKMDQSEVRINVIHSAVGAITETDVTFADASDAIIIGFNVRPNPAAKAQAEKENVDVRLYKVIYQAIEDINAARVGMLAPEFHEEDTARIEVRELFRAPKVGVIAGSYVQEGEVHRDDQVRVVRDGTVIYEGKIGSLRRFKEDVKSVKSGYECGVTVEGYQDLKEGDILEAFRTIEVAREA